MNVMIVDVELGESAVAECVPQQRDHEHKEWADAREHIHRAAPNRHSAPKIRPRLRAQRAWSLYEKYKIEFKSKAHETQLNAILICLRSMVLTNFLWNGLYRGLVSYPHSKHSRSAFGRNSVATPNIPLIQAIWVTVVTINVYFYRNY